MSTIVTRYGKGSPLTWLEVDNNFTNLNTDKIQSGNTVAALTITSATINGGTITGITDLAVADGGTGLSSLTAGYIPFGAGTSAFGSSANLFWDSANNRLGIGTASPSVKLSVYDATNCVIQSNSDATSQIIAVRYSNDTSSSNIIARKARGTFASPSAANSGDTAGSFTAQVFAGTGNRPVGQMNAIVDTYTSDTNVSGYLTFNTNGGSTTVTERMRIDSSGNVGIGINSVASKLTIAGTTADATAQATYVGTIQLNEANLTTPNAVGGIEFKTSVLSGVGYGSKIVGHNNGALLFATRANSATFTETMRIDSSGNVGIGTTTTTNKLNVSGAGVTKISIANSSVSATGYMEIDNSSYFNIYTAGGMFIGPTGANPLQFQTNNTERMRIHSSGGVSIGNTTDSGAASLNVSGSMSGGYIAHAAGTTAMAFGADNVVRVTPNATATYTSTVPAAGAICVLSILTSGTTSYTITFGTGFKSTGTLATGTVSAQYFNITFVSDGTNLIETSRTVAIA